MKRYHNGMQGHKKGKNRPLQFPPGTMPQKPIVAFAGKARARPPVFCGVWVPHATQQKAAPRQKSWRAAGEKESNESDSNFPYLKQAILGHFRAHLHLETPRNGQATQRIDYESQISAKNVTKQCENTNFCRIFFGIVPGGN